MSEGTRGLIDKSLSLGPRNIDLTLCARNLETTGRVRTREDPAEQNSAPEDGRGADRVKSSSTWERTTTGIRSFPGLERIGRWEDILA